MLMAFIPFLADMLNVKMLCTSFAGTQALTTKSMTSEFYDEIVAKVQDWLVNLLIFIFKRIEVCTAYFFWRKCWTIESRQNQFDLCRLFITSCPIVVQGWTAHRSFERCHLSSLKHLVRGLYWNHSAAISDRQELARRTSRAASWGLQAMISWTIWTRHRSCTDLNVFSCFGMFLMLSSLAFSLFWGQKVILSCQEDIGGSDGCLDMNEASREIGKLCAIALSLLFNLGESTKLPISFSKIWSSGFHEFIFFWHRYVVWWLQFGKVWEISFRSQDPDNGGLADCMYVGADLGVSIADVPLVEERRSDFFA